MEVHLDFWPAILVMPDGTCLEKVRVVVAGGRAVAFTAENGSPVVAVNVDAPDPKVQMNGLPYRVATIDGEWVITRAAGCGCGHVLKALPQHYLLGVAGIAA